MFQRNQSNHLIGCQIPRNAVCDTDGAECMPVRRDERRASVKADVRVVRDQRAVSKSPILERVGDDEEAWMLDGMSTERDAARGLRQRDPYSRLEPLPVLIDQCDQGYGGPTDLGGEESQIV